MSRVKSVLKNKNKLEREARKRRTEEISNMRADAMYRTKLNDDLELIDLILEDEAVSSVIINVSEKLVSRFLKLMYNEEMATYTIQQIDNTHFRIGRKVVTI